MVDQSTETESFRVFFNETTQPADACEEAVSNAIDAADGVTRAGELETIASDYGDVENITIDFTVEVDPTVDDDRTVRGRLLASLMGTDGYSGITSK